MVVLASSDFSVMQTRGTADSLTPQCGRVGAVLGGEAAALDEEHFHPSLFLCMSILFSNLEGDN